MGWVDEYPHELHANVLLLDGKIECWKTGDTKAEDYWPFKTPWKWDRKDDYTIQTKTWVVNTPEEHNAVFKYLSKEFYVQFEHADDYRLGRAYE